MSANPVRPICWIRRWPMHWINSWVQIEVRSMRWRFNWMQIKWICWTRPKPIHHLRSRRMIRTNCGRNQASIGTAKMMHVKWNRIPMKFRLRHWWATQKLVTIFICREIKPVSQQLPVLMAESQLPDCFIQPVTTKLAQKVQAFWPSFLSFFPFYCRLFCSQVRYRFHLFSKIVSSFPFWFECTFNRLFVGVGLQTVSVQETTFFVLRSTTTNFAG